MKTAVTGSQIRQQVLDMLFVQDDKHHRVVCVVCQGASLSIPAIVHKPHCKLADLLDQWFPPGCMREESGDACTLLLNGYQRVNLVWLLDRVLKLEPFSLADTGDWVQEIVARLEGEVDVRPNLSEDDLMQAFEVWLADRLTRL